MTPNTGIWSDFGRNEVRFWSEFGQNMVGMRSEYGRNMVGIWSEYGRNEVGIWSEYGRKWSKNTSFFNSDSTRNDSENLEWLKIWVWIFFIFHSEWGRNLVGFLPFHSEFGRIHLECVGEGKVLPDMGPCKLLGPKRSTGLLWLRAYVNCRAR